MTQDIVQYIDEKDLSQEQSLALTDFVRVVGSDDNSYKQSISDLAQLVVEGYETDLGGFVQTVKDALDALPLPASEYDASATYAVGEYCLYDGGLYRCVTAITTAEEWTPAHWEEVTIGGVLQDIATTLETKADINGDYPTLIAGNADHLLSDEKITDTVPYLFRRTGGGNTRIGHSCIPTIVGGSLVGNQLVQNGDFSDGLTGWIANNSTIDAVDGGIKITPTNAFGGVRTQVPYIGNHKILYRIQAKGENGGEGFGINNSNGANARIGTLTASKAWYSFFPNTTSTINANTTFFSFLQTEVFYVYKVMCIDLTAMLGTSIADRAYAKEQAQAGSGIAWLKSYGFISDSYEAYDTGTMKSVEATEHVTRGVNWFDKSTATDGKYINANGAEIASANYGHSDFIRVFPNMHFYMNGYAGSGYYSVLAYDENKTPMANYYGGASKTAKFDLTLPSNCYYVVLNYLLTQKNEMCFNVYDTSVNGQSIPYKEHTYPIGNVTLRGIPKVDANDNIYYDGDLYPPSGQVDRRYVLVDLGTLNWGYTDTYGFFYATLTGQSTTYTTPSYMCSKYVYGGYNTSNVNMQTAADKTIWKRFGNGTGQPSNAVYIKDSAYTDAATFKAAMSGVYLLYEKDTPTTETADPFTTPMLCDPSGTEEWVTDNGVPVGQVTEYNVNLKGKLETLPDFPTSAGEYKLKVTVTGGVAAYSWEAIT